MLNEWSDRAPEPPRRPSAFALLLAIIIGLATLMMIGQLLLSILGE